MDAIRCNGLEKHHYRRASPEIYYMSCSTHVKLGFHNWPALFTCQRGQVGFPDEEGMVLLAIGAYIPLHGWHTSIPAEENVDDRQFD